MKKTRTACVGLVLCALAVALGCAPSKPADASAEIQLDLDPPALSAEEKRIAAGETVAIPTEPEPPASPEEPRARAMLMDLEPAKMKERYASDAPMPLPGEPRSKPNQKE